MSKEQPKSICEKHNLEICEDCMINGVWTFPSTPTKEAECLDCGLLRSVCEMENGGEWVQNCQKIEGKKHKFLKEAEVEEWEDELWHKFVSSVEGMKKEVKIISSGTVGHSDFVALNYNKTIDEVLQALQDIKVKMKYTKEQKESAKIVTLYMKALGDEKLSVKTWKKIARVNQILLDKEIK